MTPPGPPRRGPFAIVQLELPFPLGPPDGRYLLRADRAGDPQAVLVLRTLGAPKRRVLAGRRRPRRAARADADPEPVTTARASVVRAEPFESEDAARAWVAALRRDRAALAGEAAAATLVLNRLLHAQRVATADPALPELRPDRALVVRAGWGSGDAAADGRFAEAVEWRPVEGGAESRGRARRADQLAPQERVAALLAGREQSLACEELVLRARADLDAGRGREAALQARIAIEALLSECAADELGPHADKLGDDRARVADAANAALAGDPSAQLAAAVAEAVERMEAALRRRRLRLR